MSQRPNAAPYVIGCAVLGVLGAGAIILGVAIGVGLQPRNPGPTEPAVVGAAPAKSGKPGIMGQITPSGPPAPDPALLEDQCDDLQSGGPTRDGCITDVITCGTTVTGHTRGGTRAFDTRFYEKKFCTPGTTNHDGGDERIYRLKMPDGEWHAEVYLDTPCADLDLAAMRWSGDGCPTMASRVDQCEMFPANGREREHLTLVHQGTATWLLVVEGKGDEEGAFALTVECYPGLH